MLTERDSDSEGESHVFRNFLEPGDHEIKLIFKRPGVKASLTLSAVGIVIFIIALIIRRRRIKIKK